MSLKPHVRVVSAEVERDGRYLITQRRPQATMPLLWEFPGGKVEAGEADEAALQRELRECLGVEAEIIRRVLLVSHEYQGYTLDLVVYKARLGAEPSPLKAHALAWISPEEFDDYPFPDADQRTVDALLD